MLKLYVRAKMNANMTKEEAALALAAGIPVEASLYPNQWHVLDFVLLNAWKLYSVSYRKALDCRWESKCRNE